MSRSDSVIGFHRFPYLHYGNSLSYIKSLQKALDELGYRNGYVTVDNYDWYINAKLNEAKKNGQSINWPAAEALYVKALWAAIRFYDELAIKTLGRSPQHVLLLHENDSSALFLNALVGKIKKEGWQIVSPLEAYKDPISKRLPEVVFRKQGRIAALAAESGVEESKLRHEYESVEAIDRSI